MSSVIKIFAPIVSFATSHATALSLVGLVVAAGTCVHERDNRIRTEAQREVYVERFTETLTRVERLEAERARADSQAVLDARRFAEMRREADSLRAVAEAAADSAATEVAEAGDSLDATLDSLQRVAPPSLHPLIAKAKDQHREERAAHRSMREAMREERRQLAGMLAAADSVAQTERARRQRAERVSEARALALREARAAVGASSEAGPSWGSRLLWAGAGAVVGGLAVAAGM